jgi:uncharacterized membrane protein
MTIRNPLEWGSDQLKFVAQGVGSAIHAVHKDDGLRAPLPTVRRIGTSDLKDALSKGLGDFAAYRTDVIFLCLIYPIIGLILGRVIFGQGMLSILFPLVSGFALIGPFVAVGLYEMSRRREQGVTVGWADAFHVIRLPTFGAILTLGLLLTAILLLWLVSAETIYAVTLGPEQPASIASFFHDLFATSGGWALMIAGIGVGFVFAVLVLAISVVSFPLLVDRHDLGLDVAIRTSVRAVMANKQAMAVWGLIIAGALVIGSIPFLLGLAFVMPLLGHATWHLYRKLVT